MTFYTSLIGDSPYPALTLALIEKDLPGGHSPAYLAVLNQPLPTTSANWSGDPAAFIGFPEYSSPTNWPTSGGARRWAGVPTTTSGSARASRSTSRRSTRRSAGATPSSATCCGAWPNGRASRARPARLARYRLGHIQGDSRIFRAVVYNKSAVTLHMLRRIVGDEAFFRGVRRLYFGFRFEKADTRDVREAFERESGLDLTRFFDTWIGGSGTPLVTFGWSRPAGSPSDEALVRIEQRGKESEFPVTVTIQYTDGRAEDTQVIVRGRAAEFRVPIKGTVRDILLNRDGLTPLDIVEGSHFSSQ